MLQKYAIAISGFFILACATSGVAQQTGLYSLYMMDRYAFNPAYGGLDASLSINAGYRTQWVDLPGNPVQQHVNAHMPLYLLNGAVGASLSRESIGAESTFRGQLSYNYVYEHELGIFTAGLAVGVIQKSLDGAALRAPGGDYEGPTIIHNDPNLPVSMVRGMRPLISAGVYYAGTTFEAGVSVTDYTGGDIDVDGIRFKGRSTVHAFGEYYIDALPELDLYPTLIVRSDLVQTQVEVSVRAVYDGFLTGGAGLRGYNANSIDAVVLFAGLRLSDHLSMAYGFDMTISALSQATRGSHELVLKYNLNKIIGAGLPPPVIYSPRFRN